MLTGVSSNTRQFGNGVYQWVPGGTVSAGEVDENGEAVDQSPARERGHWERVPRLIADRGDLAPTLFGELSTAARGAPRNVRSVDTEASNTSDPWWYDNISLEGGFKAGLGIGISVNGNANFSEISADVALIGALVYGASTHYGIQFNVAGPGVVEGWYGVTELCGGVGIGGCVSVSHQNGSSTVEVTIGGGFGLSFTNGLAYHESILGPAAMPKGR